MNTHFNPELEQFIKNAQNFDLRKVTNEADYVYDNADDSSANYEDEENFVVAAESHYFYFKKMNSYDDEPITLDLAELSNGEKVFAMYYDAAPLLYGRPDCTAEYKPIEHLNSKEFLNKLKKELNKRYEEFEDEYIFE